MVLPLTLKIILVLLVIQFILVFVLRKKKRIIVLLAMLPVLGIGIWQGLYEYNRPNKDLSKTKADVKISVIALINEFKVNDSTADKKYLGKIIELIGKVNSIENDDAGNYTMILGESGALSSVRCIIDTLYSSDAARVSEGSSVTIRGAYTGFKKNELLGENLGSDIEINRAVVIKNH